MRTGVDTIALAADGAIALAARLHTLDPFAFRVTETFGLRWYGLAYVAGFVIAWAWLRALAKRSLVRLAPEQADDYVLAVVLGVVAGGRLGYAALYSPSLLWEFGGSFPFWGLLDLSRGGMASHGGMLGILAAAWWIHRRTGAGPLHLLDAAAAVGLPGVFLGRLANFINGELLGKVAAGPGEPAPAWAVRFPQELLERPSEVAWERVGGRLAELAGPLAPPGSDPLGYAALARLVEAVQADEPGVRAAIEPLLNARHPSQLYQALAEGVVCLAVIWIVWARPRRPGVVLAWFLITYGAGRIVTEFWRLPDAHLATPELLGLSRGQWLSAVMALGGAGLLGWIVARKPGEPVGGWLAPRAGRAARAG